MMPLLSRPSNSALHDPQTTSAQTPSIRLISATPSAAGMSSEASKSFSNSPESSWTSVSPSALLPKPDAPNRKRLVPKKSKLGLLGGVKVKDKEKSRGKDLSDVLRRVGADTASVRDGFEIYVDPTNDPELEDVVVVKKKKSRAALNGLRWGPLGEVTNVPNGPKDDSPSNAALKVKVEEEKKWWSIGRGRNDSKEKGKEQESKQNLHTESPAVSMRPKMPKLKRDRARFNSFDSGILLNPSVNRESPGTKASSASEQLPRSHPLQSQRSFTPESLKEACRSAKPVLPQRSATPASTINGLLAPPNASTKEQGSIALRAIRSVRSLAKIGGWVQTSQNIDVQKEGTVKQKREKKAKKSKKKKEEEGTLREKKVLNNGSLRLSTSSFEAGTLSPTPEVTARITGSQTMGKKKRSILGIGIGLPSSMRLPSARSGSTASSIFLQPTRSPVEGVGTKPKERLGSTISTGSSLRPLSTASSSGASARTGGSRGSIKWDEEGIRSDKREIQKEKKKKKKKKDESDDRQAVDGWKRTPLSEIFPQAASNGGTSAREAEDEVQRRFSTAYPIVTIEEATVDGHSIADGDEIHDSLVYGGIWKEGDTEKDIETTPKKRQRVRPMSEQMLGRTRPHAMYEDEEGVLSILDAATNDLAQLINNLDLEATPTTPDLTPIRPSPLPAHILDSIHSRGDVSPSKREKLARGNDSPLKNRSPPNMTIGSGSKGLNVRGSSSITSLRPYAQSRGTATKTLTTPVFSDGTVKKTVIKKKSSEIGIGQPITPWPVLLQQLSPLKDRKLRESEKENAGPPKDAPSKTGTWRNGHKRTMTPGPEPEPEPVFQPLKPPRSRVFNSAEGQDDKAAPQSTNSTVVPPAQATNVNATKGSLSPPRSLRQKASAFLRKSCSLLPIPADVSIGGDSSFPTVHSSSVSGSNPGNTDILTNGATLVRLTTKKQRRLPATLGGSDVSCYAIPELDASDPDSDIPDELQFILKTNTDCYPDDGYNFNQDLTSDEEDEDDVEHPRSAASSIMASNLVPKLPPLFQTSLRKDSGEGDVDDREHADEESDLDTKHSFDFTGELQKLNESGASDRQSFVEQLENAFRTPANIDLKDFGGLLKVEVPPVPRIPAKFLSNKDSVDFSKRSLNTEDERKPSTKDVEEMQATEENVKAFDICTVSRSVEPTFQLPSQDESPGEDDSTPIPNSESLSCPLDVNQLTVRSDYNTSSMKGSHPSDGKLNTSFKFGGNHADPLAQTDKKTESNEASLTLSDIIPPLSHVRSLSSSSNKSDDDSVFQSILAKASEVPQPRLRIDSDSSERPNSSYRQSCASSTLSFTGLDSFEEVRRGFEFHPNNLPVFFPPAPTNVRRNNTHYRDSLMSIATVSSYGRVINPGVPDPFDYGLPSLRERPSSEDLSSVSFSIDDTFSFLNHASRRRVDSDASSFYFRAPLSRGSHRRPESTISIISPAPPVSFYNRSLGVRRRNDSTASNVSRNAWRSSHRYSDSVDSIMSDFSAMRLGRPGLGDKMFEMVDQSVSLAPITASPDSVSESPSYSVEASHQPTYDSIIDGDRRSLMNESDSIFDRTGQRTCTTSDDSVFGHDSDSRNQTGFLPPHQFRPLSDISMDSVHSPAQEGDTLISMLGGGHVRRCSLGSIMEASPCARVEKRKHATFSGSNNDYHNDTPNKARIVESTLTAPSFQLGANRMAKAQSGLQDRKSLEESVLSGDGEDSSFSFHSIPAFSRPLPASRSRSSTCTSSSGGDTPPLSASDGSSISGSSMSSIDLSEINFTLSNTAHLTSTLQHARARARLHGHGHRRRYSLVRSSRSESVYETIEEERLSPVSSPAHSILTEMTKSPTRYQPVFVVDEDTAMIHANPEESVSIWDDEKGIVALRKFYALRDEAENTVMESKRKWSDTPFSMFAVQSFQPPRHPEGMQALLQHSVQNYGPLPSELRSRRMRSRKDSRPSPYPQNRVAKVTTPPEAGRISPMVKPAAEHLASKSLLPTRVFSNKGDNNAPAVAPSKDALKPLSTFVLNTSVFNHKVTIETGKENSGAGRPRVGSEARRTALGWTKRNGGPKGSTGLGNGNIVRGKLSTGATTMSTVQKENVVGLGSVSTSGNSLRINRPRPRGRTTPSSTVKKMQKPIRV